MDLTMELKTTPLQLKCHLWVAALKVVQISLLLLGVAFGPPGANFPGGIEILDCWQTPDRPLSRMHRLIHVSVCISSSGYTTLSGGVQCNIKIHFADCRICLQNATCTSIEGNSLDVTPMQYSWVGKGVDWRTFDSVATPQPIWSPSRIPMEERGAKQLHPKWQDWEQTTHKEWQNKLYLC